MRLLDKTSFLCFVSIMRYKIELRYFYGWDDAGWTDATDSEIIPTRFESIHQAQVALDKLFADVKSAVITGDMDVEEVRDDYRIVAVNDGFLL